VSHSVLFFGKQYTAERLDRSGIHSGNVIRNWPVQISHCASKTLKENHDFNLRRSLPQEFIYRVEIGLEAIKIYWNLDQEFFERELKIKKPSARDDGFLKTVTYSSNSGSQRLTHGAQDWTRTSMLLALAPETSASTNSATWALNEFH